MIRRHRFIPPIALLLIALVVLSAPSLASAEGRYNRYDTLGDGEAHGFFAITGMFGKWDVSAFSAPGLLGYDAEDSWMAGITVGESGSTGLHYVGEFDVWSSGNNTLFNFLPIGVRFEMAMPQSPSEGFTIHIGVHTGMSDVLDTNTDDLLICFSLQATAGVSWYTESFVIYLEAIYGYGESVFGYFNETFVDRDDMSSEVAYIRWYGA
ncbi:MAG: hypothetical protein AB7S36_16890, partial [Planctomycetota bacterium]